jgi:hypothetical protein
MPRGLPPPESSTHSFGHDAIALCFFVASVAATLALVSSMCSACGSKPKAAAAASYSGKPGGADSVANGDIQKDGAASEEEEEVVVMLSPELATHGPIAPVALPSSTSKRRLSMSLSKTIPDKLRLSRRERKEHKVESEDTLWKKGIILGEKCRIPGERDGEASDDAVDPGAESSRRSSYSGSSSFAMHQQDTPARASHS